MAKIFKCGIEIADSTPITNSIEDKSVNHVPSMAALKYKINQPLDIDNEPTDGVNGQLLRTLGDGSTEWTDAGLPTDAQTATAISAWLAAHPEATTTVQDGSITNAKLVQTGGILEEVHDIRNGIDNVVYSSAGDAVRSIATLLKQTAIIANQAASYESWCIVGDEFRLGVTAYIDQPTESIILGRALNG